MLDQKATMSELIEIAHLDDILERMLKKRIYRKEQEVLEYVTQARALVQSTVRD
ncbi:MAG: hypothetical protein ACFE8U_06385 [Candidatus Hermodarchaeota archaeon]